MYTSEFIEKVEALPFVKKTYKHLKSIQIVDEHGDNIMYVRTDKYYGVDARSIAFDRLTDYEQEQLMPLVWQYISTTVKEREPEGRYTLSAKSHVPTVLLDVEKYYGKIWQDSDFRKQQLDWIEMTFDKEWIDK